MTGLQLTSEVVVHITDTAGVDALDVFGPRIDFLSGNALATTAARPLFKSGGFVRLP